MLASLFEVTTVTTAPQQEEQPTPEKLELPAVTQLEKRLREMQRSEQESLHSDMNDLKERLEVEKAIIAKADNYDLKAESRKEGFDRNEAVELQGARIVASEVAKGLSDDIAAVNSKLRGIDAKYNSKITKLNTLAENLDVLRRSVAVAWVQGSGGLRMDSDHIARWLGTVQSTEQQLFSMFNDESDWPTVHALVDQLTHYTVPASCTDMLYAGLTRAEDRERFTKYAPTTTEEGVDTNE